MVPTFLHSRTDPSLYFFNVVNMSIKFLLLLQLLLFTGDSMETKGQPFRAMKIGVSMKKTVIMKFHSGLNKVSSNFQMKVKPFFNDTKSKMKRKIERTNSSESNSTSMTALYKLKSKNAMRTLPMFNDPYFHSQFYMIPTKRSPKHTPPYDINVLPVWTKDRNFGENVTIIILDNDVDTSHPELRDNYDPQLSLNFKSILLLTPWPLYDGVEHEGTKMAGIITMKANNENCGVGVAPRAKFGVISLPDHPTNEDLARALSFSATADILFTSWSITYKDHALSPYVGPVLKAYEQSARKGRSGRGVIHVVPVGNRGSELFMCGSNVILQSIYTIGVTGSEFDGRTSVHSEYCAAVMVTAYSSFGTDNEYMTVVPDIKGSCTRIHGGSGSAAALVTGVIALALSARPSLTWREIQHCIVWTSEISPLQQDSLIWKTNGAGFYISEFFGFGMINAYSFVKLAKRLKPIPPMISCGETVYDYTRHRLMEHPSKTIREFTHQIANCTVTQGKPGQRVHYIEHVQLRVSLAYASKRGDIEITLKSPSGTEVTLLGRQPDDHSTKGMLEWYFDSVLMWGEPSEGKWTVRISKHFSVENTPEIFVQRVYLLIHGTQTAPPHYFSRLDKRKMRRYKKPVSN